MSYLLSSLPSLIAERTKIYFYMIMMETSSKIARKCSATFGNIRKSSDIFGKFGEMIENVRMNFWKSSENFQKSSEMSGNVREIAQIFLILLFI